MADELVKVRYGLNSQLPTVKDDNTLYFVTDTKKIYRGDVEYTGNIQGITLTPVTDGTIGSHTMTISFKDGSPSIAVNILSYTAVQTIISVLNGTATGTTKGLVTLSDAIDSTSDVSGGIAATPKSVSDALEEAKNYADGLLGANDAMQFKGTIGSSGATVTTLPTNNYQAGWTYKVATAGTYAGEACEVGDMIIAVKDGPTTGATVKNEDWTVVQANIDGAVTATANLDQDQLVVGGGNNKTIKKLPAGQAGQVVTMVDGKPTWANLPTEKDTTYTFANGTDGSFTVTPLGGSAQKVTIGKPATAGTADTANVALKGKISGAYTAFGAAAAKGVSTSIANNADLITASAVYNFKTTVDTWQGTADDKFDELYDALTWKSFATA